MTQSPRLSRGGLIERWNPLRFNFDGRGYTGYAGDTLASALLANGVHMVGRSFKYHRPRGIVAAGAEEPNALIRVVRDDARATPNCRATQVELYDGLRAESQNAWPGLRHDVGALAGLAAPLLPPGFYYKTFMPSLGAWRHVFEPLIRRAGGIGRAPERADPDRYTNRHAHCDVLVIGAGPAGLAAAREAAATGARVILCDEQPMLGGTLLAENDFVIEGQPARDWTESTAQALAVRENVTLLPRATAFGYYLDNFVAIAERLTDHLADPDPGRPRERLWQVRAREVVLATGAIERPLVFPGNDRPGIMLADAARTYLNRYAVRVGTQAVIVTAHDSAYQSAIDLYRAGVAIPVIADARPHADGEWPARARAAGIRVETATIPLRTYGRLRIHTVDLGRVDDVGAVTVTERVSCDALLMSGGWTPTVHLFSQSRGTLRFDDAIGAHVPDRSAQRERSAGACRGIFGLADAVADGAHAGAEAARAAGFTPVGRIVSAVVRQGGSCVAAPAVRIVDGRGDGHAFVDFQNDVTVKDIAIATREGFRSIQHVKRYTTAGLAPDQGKLGNINAAAITALHTGGSTAGTGLPTYRLPYAPVTFGTIAGLARGDLFEPVRRTPLHDQAAEAGAVFEDAGAWKRARYFPRAGETMHDAVARECAAVRATAGVFDASTLGKIDVSGPDAAEFLNRIYATRLDNLRPGQCRYAIMLTEAGYVLDDGIVARLSDTVFHVTTTTSGAARVLAQMEDYRQTEWPGLKVWLTSTTEHWAVIAVQGPRAREVVAAHVNGVDLAGMPHMSVRIGRLGDTPVRVFRVSFTGECGYEINVPAGHAGGAWSMLHRTASAIGGACYGTEAMHVLRAEKGYIIVGQETDGTVTPHDLGFTAIGRAKADFVGKRSLDLPDMREDGRLQLVGLLPDAPLEEGAQLTTQRNPPPGTRAEGHVTSAYHSTALRRPIALALLTNGRARHDETLYVPMPSGAIAVRVAAPVFLDPAGERLRG